MNDIFIFSEENLLEQIKNGKYELGFYRIKFYTKNGLPADEKTDTISEFYLYPSGGTLRDENMNIVMYNSKFDTYRGFKAPSSSPKGGVNE
ncbi:MAG: hypothetical protein C4539_02125 [Ignavibacteriales bacterium]|nr:MAG: hypothetical protein C4539_02125 [Ignavibacteriales bacterium]